MSGTRRSNDPRNHPPQKPLKTGKPSTLGTILSTSQSSTSTHPKHPNPKKNLPDSTSTLNPSPLLPPPSPQPPALLTGSCSILDPPSLSASPPNLLVTPSNPGCLISAAFISCIRSLSPAVFALGVRVAGAVSWPLEAEDWAMTRRRASRKRSLRRRWRDRQVVTGLKCARREKKEAAGGERNRHVCVGGGGGGCSGCGPRDVSF